MNTYSEVHGIFFMKTILMGYFRSDPTKGGFLRIADRISSGSDRGFETLLRAPYSF